MFASFYFYRLQVGGSWLRMKQASVTSASPTLSSCLSLSSQFAPPPLRSLLNGNGNVSCVCNVFVLCDVVDVACCCVVLRVVVLVVWVFFCCVLCFFLSFVCLWFVVRLVFVCRLFVVCLLLLVVACCCGCIVLCVCVRFVLALKTTLCVHSKRSRVNVQNAPVCAVKTIVSHETRSF